MTDIVHSFVLMGPSRQLYDMFTAWNDVMEE